MKKMVIFLIPFIVTIPAFAEDKPLFTENFSLVKHSNNNNPGVFHLDIADPVYYLFCSEKECHSKQRQALQMPKFQQLSESIYFSMDTVIERNKQSREKPPLRIKRIGGEILVGGGLGMVGVIGLGAAGLGIGALLGGDDGEGPMIVGMAIGAGLGYSIGSALGVYLVGNNDDETGSFVSTLLGSLLGTGFSFLASITIGDEVPDVIYFIPVPPILACIGFNMTRKYKSKPASYSALLNLSEGKISLSIPKVYFYPDLYGRRTLNMNISLMSIEL